MLLSSVHLATGLMMHQKCQDYGDYATNCIFGVQTSHSVVLIKTGPWSCLRQLSRPGFMSHGPLCKCDLHS